MSQIRTCFTVVQVDQNYDYVEGVRFIDSFHTEEEANALITKMKAEQDASWKAFSNYINNFVDSIEFPAKEVMINGHLQIGYERWCEFIKEYPIGTYIVPDSFREGLKHTLKTGYTCKGCNPPKWITYPNLFVIEIKMPE